MLGKDTLRVTFGFQRQTEDMSGKVDGSKVSDTVNVSGGKYYQKKKRRTPE